MELTELCKELNNWFDIDRKFGVFTIENGSLQDDVGLKENQYFRIVGSIFNDGVYKYPAEELTDETFEGAVWAMAIPPEVIALNTDITNWESEHADTIKSPFQSESFGGYSYSKDTSLTENGASSAYKKVFGSQLNKWRKV